MKKVLVLLSIIITYLLVSNNVFASQDTCYKVIKVIDGDTIFLDFNNDGIAEQNEKVRINGIDTFEVKPSVSIEWHDKQGEAKPRRSFDGCSQLEFVGEGTSRSNLCVCQMKELNLTQNEALGLGYFGKEFAKRSLLNKYVKAEYTGETKTCDMGRHLMSVYYDNGKNYEQEVLKAGLAVVYKKSNLAPELYKYENLGKIRANVQKTHWLNLVLLNKKNNTYHKVNCEYGLKASNVELINKSILVKYKPASCCYKTNIPEEARKVNEVDSERHKQNKVKNIIHEKPEKPVPLASTGNIELYVIDGFNYKKPANYARTATIQALIKEINKAQSSIDFAVFGFSEQPELMSAILKAKKRGVKVRWVVDMTPWNFNFYGGTKYALKQLPDYASDYLADKKLLEKYQAKGSTTFNGNLIHDKYFIIDRKVVWTGSTNISSSCSGGYNTNNAVIVYSDKIADLYTQDFNKMYEQKLFHREKPVLYEKDITLNDGSVVSVFFSPNLNILNDGVLPIIDNAKNYIYMPVFYLTSQPIFEALLNAQNRGVDVKIIADAHYANTQHSKIDEIRGLGLKVKAENWGGKMHMKSLISDDEYIIVGSCNFTNTGIKNNDENMLIIKNPVLAKAFKSKFEYYWQIIPDKWLYATPQAEGPDSIGSCSDGLDNDHNGLTDKADPKCQIKY